jgi:hypothetical protein
MTTIRDVRLQDGVVWASAAGGLPISASQQLTQRAVAMAGESASRRIMLDFRRATLTHSVQALNWHAEMLSGLRPPTDARIAMLCQQPSEHLQRWELALQQRGHLAAAFTDGKAALNWLKGSVQDPAPTAEEPQDLDSVKQLMQEYADGLSGAPRSQVVAEFTELFECLLANAERLGVDAMKGLEQQLRLHAQLRGRGG